MNVEVINPSKSRLHEPPSDSMQMWTGLDLCARLYVIYLLAVCVVFPARLDAADKCRVC